MAALDINSQIDRELQIAKASWGETFELKCLEGSRGDTLDDDDLLRMLRYFGITEPSIRISLPHAMTCRIDRTGKRPRSFPV